MLLAGIIIGLAAALTQSLSYIASKVYITRGGTPYSLVVYSQLFMGGFGIGTLGLLREKTEIDFAPENLMYLGICVSSAVIGHLSSFRAVKHIEASRLSSLMGMKIIVIALLSVTLTGVHISLFQWLAVFLCSVAAAGMNFTGGRISKQGFFWLGMTLVAYAISDISVLKVIAAVKSDSPVLSSIGAAGLCYFTSGAIALFFIPFVPKSRKLMLGALPYAVIWFGAMLLLFYCFETAGIIFGTIIQSMRGIFSVILGVLLVKAGYRNIEPAVSAKAWIRRFVMAILMVLAMALYALNKSS